MIKLLDWWAGTLSAYGRSVAAVWCPLKANVFGGGEIQLERLAAEIVSPRCPGRALVRADAPTSARQQA